MYILTSHDIAQAYEFLARDERLYPPRERSLRAEAWLARGEALGWLAVVACCLRILSVI